MLPGNCPAVTQDKTRLRATALEGLFPTYDSEAAGGKYRLLIAVGSRCFCGDECHMAGPSFPFPYFVDANDACHQLTDAQAAVIGIFLLAMQ